ncbi:MAG: HAD family phosphatase [Chloroflexi bacterium]|nr:HAD family phosphatase [Chloroflexota bacterium]MCI0574851.1 HAD family phosphatase [Chloroflexota bacterium]MCI0645931.1 HAD family phosphatase [Chloroflexota bacterium]MCI0726900.1 HAD family phosphatase [Chloroflexota bacterium]
MSYQAVLFDMDGVIIDTRQSVVAFWLELAAAHQVLLTPADFDQHIHGCPATDTLEVLFPQLSSQQRQAALARLAGYEAGLSYTEVPGALALVRALKRHHLPTALVTSAAQHKVSQVTRQLDTDGLFTVQVTAGDIQRGKPDPECYLRAAQQLQQQPADCIVFEDALNGVKAAVAAGMLCIGVQPSNLTPALLQAGAHHAVPDFTSVRLLLSETSKTGPGPSLPLHTSTKQSLWLHFQLGA